MFLHELPAFGYLETNFMIHYSKNVTFHLQDTGTNFLFHGIQICSLLLHCAPWSRKKLNDFQRCDLHLPTSNIPHSCFDPVDPVLDSDFVYFNFSILSDLKMAGDPFSRTLTLYFPKELIRVGLIVPWDYIIREMSCTSIIDFQVLISKRGACMKHLLCWLILTDSVCVGTISQGVFSWGHDRPF